MKLVTKIYNDKDFLIDQIVSDNLLDHEIKISNKDTEMNFPNISPIDLRKFNKVDDCFEVLSK